MPRKSMVWVHLTPIGLLVERKGKIIEVHRFGETLEENVERYQGLEEGRIDEDVLRFLRALALKNQLNVITPLLADPLMKEEISVKLDSSYRGLTRMEKLLVDAGFARDIEEGANILHRALTILASRKVKADLEEMDKVIIHAVNANEEYTESINLFYERLREWFGIHFPELERHVQRPSTYTNLMARMITREEFSLENLLSLGIEKEKAEKIATAAERSLGADVGMSDLKPIREHAEILLRLIKIRDDLERYIEEVLDEYAPNISSLIGAKLAGKLISRSGGLKRLGMLPASTVQLLGAEKALFRALRRGAKPPKHGVIFQHPAVNQAPRWLRGKVARALANKITIATRIDVFGGESRAEELKKDFEKKLEEIRRKYSKPTVKVEKRVKRRRGKRRRK